jgi:hypothetical protein
MNAYIIAALALLASVAPAMSQKPEWYGMDRDAAIRAGLHPPPQLRSDMDRAGRAAFDAQRAAQQQLFRRVRVP